MDTRFARILWLTLSAAVLFPGCLEKYEVTTLISTDGSCERIVKLRRDSQRLPSSAFSIPADSSWACSWTETGKDTASGGGNSKKSEWVYTARKRFADFEALSREYAAPRDPASLSIRVDVEKKFRWFYTYYAYSETYARFDPLGDPLQPSAFMSGEEIRRFMVSEKPDSLLETKWKQWDQRKKDEWAFARLVDLVRRRNDPALPATLFEANKERLIQVLSHDSTSGKDTGPGKSRTRTQKDQHPEPSHNVLGVLARELHTQAVWKLGPEIDSLMWEFLRRDSIASRANGEYTNSVILPGMIVETNAQEVHGTTVVWQFSHEHLALADYQMVAESRVANVWAMVVSGIVVLLVIVFPAIIRRRTLL